MYTANNDSILLAVAHNEFKDVDFSKRKKVYVRYDIKAMLTHEVVL